MYVKQKEGHLYIYCALIFPPTIILAILCKNTTVQIMCLMLIKDYFFLLRYKYIINEEFPFHGAKMYLLKSAEISGQRREVL